MLSGLEIRRWVLAGELKGARLGKAYRHGEVFVFEVSGVPKKFLLVRPGGIYLSNYAPRGEADAFCMYLRKHFSGKRIENVRQIGTDRIVALDFPEGSLIFELFGRGNVIVTDREGVIQTALVQRKWSSREIRKGVKYVPPPSLDWASLPAGELVQQIRGKSKAEISRLLGLGKKVEDYWDEPEKMVQRLRDELSSPLSSEEVEKLFREADKEKFVEEARRRKEEKLRALEKSADDLRKTIEDYRKKAELYRRAGQYIFQHLSEIDSLLEDARNRGQKKIKVSLLNDDRDIA